MTTRPITQEAIEGGRRAILEILHRRHPDRRFFLRPASPLWERPERGTVRVCLQPPASIHMDLLPNPFWAWDVATRKPITGL